MEVLNLESCSAVDDEGVRAVARKCSRLQSINLSQCPKISDASLQELIYRCHDLTHIVIRKCAQITDVSFSQAANLPNLLQLDLSDCTQITDRTLANVSKCNKLRCFKVTGNRAQISDNGVCMMVNHCCELRVLELTGCDISDKSVRVISASCPYLKRLSLAFCKKITDAAFQLDSAIFGISGQVGSHSLFKFLFFCGQNSNFLKLTLGGGYSLPRHSCASGEADPADPHPIPSTEAGAADATAEISASRLRTTSTTCSTWI